jgi:hypothetical protein
MHELAEVVDRFEPAYREKVAFRVSSAQARALRAIQTCRTPVRGGHVWRCDDDACGRERYSYHSCRHRLCPKCQGNQTERWLERARARLLPCPHWLVTVTLPSELRLVCHAHPARALNCLMRAAQSAVLDVGWTHLKGRVGALAVLHTWTRTLEYHPHVHLLVTGGGLGADEVSWSAPRYSDYLLPQQALADRVRSQMRAGLEAEGLLSVAPRAAWEIKWIAHCQPAGSGEEVVGYLGRYVFRCPLPSSRIEAVSDETVTFSFMDSRSKKLKQTTLPGEHLLGRVLGHALPHGFVRVRWSGLLAPAAGRAYKQAAAALAEAPPLVRRTPRVEPPHEGDGPVAEPRLGVHPPAPVHRQAEHRCPVCGRGTLRLVGRLPPRRGPP